MIGPSKGTQGPYSHQRNKSNGYEIKGKVYGAMGRRINLDEGLRLGNGSFGIF
jgi:hypothetical protein